MTCAPVTPARFSSPSLRCAGVRSACTTYTCARAAAAAAPTFWKASVDRSQLDVPRFPVVRVVAEMPAEKKIIVGGMLAPVRLDSRPLRASSVSRVRHATSFWYRCRPASSVGIGAPCPATFASACRTSAGVVGSVRTELSGAVRSATRSAGGIVFRKESMDCFISRSFPGRNDPSSITRKVVRPPPLIAPATLVPNGAGRGGPDGFAPSPEEGLASIRSKDLRVRCRPSTRS